MIKFILSICFSLCFFLPAVAQKSAKRELRGAWITTHFNLDWPAINTTPTQQQAAMISILDQHKATGINAIYFQVRNQCDALYPSTIEPWSSTLTGIQGKDPGWDPLKFVIDETHKRGMELHAWLNPYRAVATASQLPNFVPNHVAKQHPEWLLDNGSVITLNPGLPQVRDYIMSVITDIAQRYDVDGIHFDDYFYPAAPVRDTATYNADPRGMTQADWRRDNINIFIKRVYDEVSVLKPWVKFGVSPTGIYRSSTNPAIGSNTSTGAYQHYSAVYADTKKWIQQGWVDYLAPQVYWYIGQSGSDYGVLIPWWNNQASGRHIYIGQSIYKVGASFVNTTEKAAWADSTQIPRQMRMNRSESYQSVFGEIAYRTANLRSNPLKVRDSIRTKIYKKPALLPTMSWRDNTAPQSPSELTGVKQTNYSYILNWIKPAATSNELDKVRQFVIYRSESSVININDTANILNITATNVNTYTDANPANKTYYYTVTSVDRLYNESVPSNVTDYVPPTITCPEDQSIILNSTCSATLSDYTTQANVSDDVSSPENIVVTQSPVAGSIINGTGNTAITLTATDGSGKSSSCIFNVKAEDREPPSLTVPEDIIVATDNDKCSSIVNYTFSASDNCSPVTIVSDFPTGSSFYKGITKVTVTATDESGNSTIKTFTVTVNDEQAPVITTNGDKTVSTDQGKCGTSVTVSATATDNCGIVTTSGIRSDNLALSDQYPLGTTTIIWTSTDANGNTATATQLVTVTDNINPIITCPAPVAATTNNGCTATGVVLGTPTTSDNCSVASVTNDHPSTTYPLGTTTVTWTVTDGSGNTSTCTQTVTVTDNINPTITCPAPVAATTNNGCTATGVSLGTPTTSDNCSVASVTNDHPSSTYPLGNTTVIWTVTDGSGNKSNCSQTVTVTDNINPTITCPAPVAATTNNGCTATGVSLGTPTTSDNCSVASVTNDHPSTTYPLGTTTVIWTVTDGSGNKSTCTQTVTVTDNINPIITCPAPVAATTNNGCTATGVSLGTPTTSDNCSVASVTNDHPSTTYPLGTTTVTWTVIDGSGNKSTCTQIVTVTDNINPTITCPTDITVAPISLSGTVVTFAKPAGNDNCSVASVIQTAGLSSGSTFPIGTSTVSYKVTDGSENTATCSFTITVIDPYCDKKDNSKKVYVCHNGNTICISVNALQTHLDHGDYLGACTPASNLITRTATPMEKAAEVKTTENKVATVPTQVVGKGKFSNSESFKVVVYPNPSTTDFKLQVLSNSNEPLSLRVVDVLGRTITTMSKLDKNQLLTVGSGYKSGIYFAEVKQGIKQATVKLVKLN